MSLAIFVLVVHSSFKLTHDITNKRLCIYRILYQTLQFSILSLLISLKSFSLFVPKTRSLLSATAPAHTINKLSYGLKAVECLLQILSEGYGIKFGKKVASIDFFHFLKQINKMICLWRKTDGIFEHEILGDVIKFNTTIKNKCYEDFITMEEQYLLYSGSCFLIQSDSNFKDFIQNNHILQCHIYKDFR